MHGENAANPKNVDRHEKRVEVEDLAMSEWMKRVGRTGAALDSQKQQQLVSGICCRVKSFGQHGRASRKHGRQVLEDCNCQICGNGDVNHSLG